MKLRVFLVAVLAVLISACSSGVKLDDVPVEDRQPSQVGTVQPGQDAQSQVRPVTADTASATAAGPVGVARLVYFDYDSHEIKPEFKSLIDAHARFLRANAGRKVVIEGHTDERGGREYNLALGQKRSEAVRRALSLLGVPDSQLEAVSFGKEKPAAAGSDEAAWAQNRRAEISYR